MSDLIQIIIGTFILFTSLILSYIIKKLRIKKTYQNIIDDLKKSKAFNINSAVKLPYAKKRILKMGSRDFHLNALKSMESKGIVKKTSDGEYYLTDNHYIVKKQNKF